MFLLTKYVMALQEAKMRGGYFYLGACTQGKIDAFHLVRTVSPTHTEVSVFLVFVYIYLLPSKEPRNQGKAGA